MADVPGRVGLIDQHDLGATLDLAARQRVTIISAPAGSGNVCVAALGRSAGSAAPITFVSVWAGRNAAVPARSDRRDPWCSE